MNDAAQELAFQKNNFYRDQYRITMLWVVRLAVVGVILSVILGWMIWDPKQPPYYATMTTGEVIPLHSLSQPVVTDEFITQWAALTTRAVFNLNFSTYQQELNELKNKFTLDGWEKMYTALQSSGLIDSMVSNKLIISSVVSGAIVIVSRYIVRGRYTWRVQMPLLVKFTSASESRQRQYLVTMDIQRVPTLETSQGIQIVNYNAGLMG